MALFYSDELKDAAEQLFILNCAASRLFAANKWKYLANNFDRYGWDLDDDEYNHIMSLWLLFINEYIKTDGEII